MVFFIRNIFSSPLFFVLFGFISFSFKLISSEVHFVKDGAGRVTVYQGVSLSGLYSDSGVYTPQVVVIHDYNPIQFSRVILAIKRDMNHPLFDQIWKELQLKMNITTAKPNQISVVIQRRQAVDGAPIDIGNLRPHYALFNILPGDPCLKGRYNQGAQFDIAKIVSFSPTTLLLNNGESSISAHPGGGSTVLSPDNLKLRGQGDDTPLLLFSYFKVKSLEKSLLTLHYIPTYTEQEIFDAALESLAAEESLKKDVNDVLEGLKKAHEEIYGENKFLKFVEDIVLANAGINGSIAERL